MSAFESEMTGPAKELVNSMVAEARNELNLEVEPGKFHHTHETQELSEENLNELLPSLTKENKMWILTALGFSPRGLAKWYHPIFGGDFVDNHIYFDLDTDDIRILVNKVFKFGYRRGDTYPRKH